MTSDPFFDFIGQGAVIRLIVFLVIMVMIFILWGYVTRRNTVRRRLAADQGLPPPPGTMTEVWRYLMGFMKNLFSSDDDHADAGEQVETPAQDLDPSLPLPELDFPAVPREDEPLDGELVADVDAAFAEVAQEEQAVVEDNEDEEAQMPLPVGQEPQRSEGLEYIEGSGELPLDAVEVMRVWRDINDGSLIVQMGDTLFRFVGEMEDRGLAKRFIRVVQDLAQMATIGAQAAGLPTPDFEASTGLFTKPGAWSNSTPAVPIVPPAAPAPPRRPIITMTPNDPIKDIGQDQPLGIAGQIDRLLQIRLQQTPVFRGRKISMGSAPNGSIEITVDDRVYNGVDSIEDREVREFIQRVVKEWEASQ